MNMQVAIPLPSSDLPWSRVTEEINAWRGACLQCFAQAEAAVTETLLFLSSVDDRGKTVQLRHLLGQRLDDLAQALAPDGGFAAEGGKAFSALSAFRAHEKLRAHLAHDVARIALERNGNWVVVFRQLSIRGRTAERGTTAFEQHDAVSVLAELRRKGQKLDVALANLRRSIEAATPIEGRAA